MDFDSTEHGFVAHTVRPMRKLGTAMTPVDPVDEGLTRGMPAEAEVEADVTVELAVDGGVVVGDDGSSAATAALRWAAEDAVRRGTTLHVVRCWSLLTAPRPSSWQPGYVPPLHDWEAAVLGDLRREASAVVDLTRTAVQWHAVHRQPGEVLTQATDSADLVVVGSRGHGRLHELLLGSVAEHVVHHARGPVVVVRSAHGTEGRPR